MMNGYPKILDLGCGVNKTPRAVGMDIDPNSNAEIIHDFNAYPYPIEDNSFDRVMAKHIIEHLNDPQSFIFEIYRILKPNGTAFIETPHFSSYVAYSEPQHKLFYSYFLLYNMVNKTKFETVKQEITFYKFYRLLGIKWLANKHPRTYERFWTFLFPAENVTIKLRKK